MDYQLQEGCITLPKGFSDRTVNMFVLGQNIPAPLSITLSRDIHLQGEDLNTYLQRQLKLLTSRLRSYTVLARKAIFTSNANLEPGMEIEAYYLNEAHTIHQRQAAFMIGGGQVLVFSYIRQADFTDQQNRDWTDLMANFTPRSETTLNSVKE
ncbi:DUF1795 domain-containing protein [Pseudomonas alliivorans]|nr:DUF1795 domain-containing protein [Pseudomonas alliivorans]